MPDQPLDSPKVIVVTVGIGVYRKPKDGQTERRAFPRLSQVAKDVERLTGLLGGEPFQQQGVRVLPPITGTDSTVRRELTKVVDQVAALPGCRLVVLWSSHAETIGAGDLRLATSDSLSPMRAGDGWAPEHLVDVLSGAKAQGLLILLDVCYAGQGLPAAIGQAADRMRDAPPASGAPLGFGIIGSAQRYEKAKDGVFATVLEKVLREGQSAAVEALFREQGFGAVSDQNRSLTPRDLDSLLRAEFSLLHSQDSVIQSPTPALIGADFPVFPNPRFNSDPSPRSVAELGPYVSGVDAAQHFLPKARGLEPGKLGWDFTGRVEASRRISRFLSKLDNERLLVVTGRAGVGKSAVLGRAVALADASFRRSLAEGTDWNEAAARRLGTLPPVDGIDAALHLRGLGTAGTARQLGELLDLDLTAPVGASPAALVEQLLAETRELEEPPTIVLDALDEADEPQQIADAVIRPLVELGCRVVVGTRRAASARGAPDLLGSLDLPGAAPYLDLSVDASSTADIADYVERRLTIDTSTYARRSSLRSEIAEAISRQSGGQFLYAKLTADDLVSRPAVTLDDLAGTLTGSVGAAFARTLARLDEEFATEFGTAVPGATVLATGLAWGEGRGGVPLRDGLWPLIATATTEDATPFTEQHCYWFLARAGQYVLESGDGEQAVYRLYHEALHEHLRVGADVAAVRARIAHAFLTSTEASGGWPLANPYVVRYLTRYLEPSPVEQLTEVCTDPAYLARALEVLGVDGTARVLDNVRLQTSSPALVAVAKAVRRARVALARDPGQLAAQLVARLGGESDPALQELVRTAPTVAPPVWLRPVNLRLDWSAELQTTQTLPGKVRALAADVLDVEPALLLGAGETILRWDPRHGAVEGMLDNEGMRPIALAVGMLGGRPVVAAASYEGSIAVRDVDTGELVVPLVHANHVASLTIAAGPVSEVGGRVLADEEVNSVGLDEDTALYWSGRSGLLCTLAGQLGLLLAEPQGFRIKLTGRADELVFPHADSPRTDPLLLTVSNSPRDETLLGVAEDDHTVRLIRSDGAPPQWVQLDFPIRCLALTWIDGQPYVAAANRSDRGSGSASYVSIRQPSGTALSYRPPLDVVGVGQLGPRLVAVLGSGEVVDAADGSRVGAAPDAVTITAGLAHPVLVGSGEPESTQEWPVTARALGRWRGATVALRGSYEGVVWVWDVAAQRYIAGPFTERAEGRFHHAKGREVRAVRALAIGEVDGSTWVVAADSEGVVVRDVATGVQLETPDVGQSGIQALSLGAVAGRHVLATGSDGGAVTVWEVGSWQRLAGFTMDDPVSGLWLADAQLVVQTGALPLACFELVGLHER